MSIPVAQTTITVLRPAGAAQDQWDRDPTAVPATIASHVRAVIVLPSGNELQGGGTQEDVRAALRCDPCDVQHTDRVLDETTSLTWEVVWARLRPGFGLDHIAGQLRMVTGEAQ